MAAVAVIKIQAGTQVLKIMMEVLTQLASDANIFFTPNGGLTIKPRDLVSTAVVVITISKGSFEVYKCNQSYSACLPLYVMKWYLKDLTMDDSLTLTFDFIRLMLRIYTRNARTDERRGAEVQLLKYSPTVYKIDETKSQYDILVGISNTKFEGIFTEWRGTAYKVTVTITEKDVKFSAKRKETILRAENGDCVIGSNGNTFKYPVSMSFSFHRAPAFVTASNLTNMVWFCYSADALPLLNIPLGDFANMHIYSRMM